MITPLFQSNFLPDFKQVNFFPSNVENAPTFLHVSPAFIAAKAGIENEDEINTSPIKKAKSFLTMSGRLL